MASHEAKKRVALNGGAAIVSALNGVLSVSWEKEDGKAVKSVPAGLKRSDPEGVERVKTMIRDIRADLSTWKDKIERFYIGDVSWTYAQWRERYADHGTLSLLARRLVWTGAFDAATLSFLPIRDGNVDCQGKPVAIPDDAIIRLWHPLNADREEVTAWRDLLMSWETIQPFRQVWREVYRLTDAERATATYSNRFAGHILKQHQMIALAVANGWHCQHRTGFDSPDDEPTYLPLPEFGVHAEYWTSAFREVEQFTPGGSYLYIKTDRVAFHRYDPRARPKRGDAVSFTEIPPLLFSEVMRHCDLFTSVASLSLDPEWVDRGSDAKHPSHYDETLFRYWGERQDAPLPPSAVTRREMLEALLPKLAIADRVSLSGNHIDVQGTRHTYRIHIGSGAVSIAGRQQHICIIPNHSGKGKTIALPFDGDSTLSIILSKMMLLVDDHKIKDPVILTQIR
ncbi:MAG: DUF4132 domain-containing protein [Pseudomonadota bacterium]